MYRYEIYEDFTGKIFDKDDNVVWAVGPFASKEEVEWYCNDFTQNINNGLIDLSKVDD
jgi:hypothetical protein